MQLSLEIPIQTTWKGGEKMEDFSLYFTVEIYGDIGWEVVSKIPGDILPGMAWKEACKYAENFAGEGYQVRVTSPVGNRKPL